MSTTFEEEFETPEMETLAGLAEHLVYRLPGCTDLMVRKTLQEVYRDFCRRSCCLRVRRQFKPERHESRIEAIPAYGGMVDRIVELTADGRKLDEGRDYVVEGSSALVRPILVNGFFLNGPHRHRTFSMYHVEIPKIGQEQAPKWLLERYGEALCSGVLSRLMSMTGKAWTDAAQAAVENVKYENFVNEARIGYYSGSDTGNGNPGFGIDTSDLL